MSFDGFDPASVALLDDLPHWGPDEYAAHRQDMTAGVVRPGGELIAGVADRLDARLTVVPRSSVSPLHRDLRFAAEGAARYKDHLLLTTWEGSDKKASPMLWIRIDSTNAGFASGIGFTPAIRELWRSAVGGDPGAELVVRLDRLVHGCGAEIAGEQVKRVPPPYDATHPRADLLRRTGFQVRVVEPLPPFIDAPEFADWCVERLSVLLPVHRWMIDNLVPQ